MKHSTVHPAVRESQGERRHTEYAPEKANRREVAAFIHSERAYGFRSTRRTPETSSIVSALKIYTTLKKISTKTVYYEKS